MSNENYNSQEFTKAMTILANDMIRQQSPFTINVCDLPDGEEIAITTSLSKVTEVLLTNLAGMKIVVDDPNLMNEDDIDDCLHCVEYIKSKLLEYKG